MAAVHARMTAALTADIGIRVPLVKVGSRPFGDEVGDVRLGESVGFLRLFRLRGQLRQAATASQHDERDDGLDEHEPVALHWTGPTDHTRG